MGMGPELPAAHSDQSKSKNPPPRGSHIVCLKLPSPVFPLRCGASLMQLVWYFHFFSTEYYFVIPFRNLVSFFMYFVKMSFCIHSTCLSSPNSCPGFVCSSLFVQRQRQRKKKERKKQEKKKNNNSTILYQLSLSSNNNT